MVFHHVFFIFFSFHPYNLKISGFGPYEF